jgi:hypothetical protein
MPPPGRGQGVVVREKIHCSGGSSRLVTRRGRGQGVAERQNPLRRGMSLGYSERSRKNRRIRGFRCLAVTFVIFVHFQHLSVVMPRFVCPTGDTGKN